MKRFSQYFQSKMVGLNSVHMFKMNPDAIIDDIVQTINMKINSIIQDISQATTPQLPSKLKQLNEVIETYNLLLFNLGALKRNINSTFNDNHF